MLIILNCLGQGSSRMMYLEEEIDFKDSELKE